MLIMSRFAGLTLIADNFVTKLINTVWIWFLLTSLCEDVEMSRRDRIIIWVYVIPAYHNNNNKRYFLRQTGHQNITEIARTLQLF